MVHDPRKLVAILSADVVGYYRLMGCDESGTLAFGRALQLDPSFASAHAMAAWRHNQRKVSGWMVDRPHEIADGVRLAQRAIKLSRDDAVALPYASRLAPMMLCAVRRP